MVACRGLVVRETFSEGDIECLWHGALNTLRGPSLGGHAQAVYYSRTDKPTYMITTNRGLPTRSATTGHVPTATDAALRAHSERMRPTKATRPTRARRTRDRDARPTDNTTASRRRAHTHALPPSARARAPPSTLTTAEHARDRRARTRPPSFEATNAVSARARLERTAVSVWACCCGCCSCAAAARAAASEAEKARVARAAAVRGVAVRGEARWRVGSGAGGSSTRPRSGRAPVLVLCDAEEASALVGAAAVTLAVAVAAEKAMAMRAAARAVARAAAHKWRELSAGTTTQKARCPC